jgi:hypothetical protein
VPDAFCSELRLLQLTVRAWKFIEHNFRDPWVGILSAKTRKETRVTIFKTSAVGALALLLTSHAEAQKSAKVCSDSPSTAQLRCTPDSRPTESEVSDAQSGCGIETPACSMIWPLSDPEALTATRDAQTLSSSASSKDPPDWQVDLYPVFGWAPIFGASASVSAPSPGPAPAGSVSGSFNGAAFAGFGIEKGKWAAAGNVLWAGLSAERQIPLVRVDTNFIYGQFMLGREVLPNLFVEAGFRRTAIKIAARVSTFPQVTWKPGVWDPLVGLTYRRSLGRKWHFRIHGDGGGFGVGNDASVSGTASAEWRFTRHFELLFGYGFLYFRDSGVVLGQPFRIKETLNGPMLGFGIHLGRP